MPRTISRVISFGATAPGMSTAPITTSASRSDSSIWSVEDITRLTRPERTSSRCRMRSIERSRMVTLAPRPGAMTAALYPPTPPPITPTRPGATPGTPPSKRPRPPSGFSRKYAPACAASRPAISLIGASSGSARLSVSTVSYATPVIPLSSNARVSGSSAAMCKYVKSTSPSRSRAYSAAIGSFTLSNSSESAHKSSTETMRAPTASYAESGNELPSPAVDSTTTSCPRCTSSRAPAGVSATRYSSGLISLATPILTTAGRYPLGRNRPRRTFSHSMLERIAGNRVHYAWFVVVATFVTLITTAGFRATPAVLIVPLEQEYGWSPATISIAISLGLVMFGLGAPFSAALMESYGVRRVMLVALVIIAIGTTLTTLIDAPWQLDLLWGVVVGGATGAVSVPLAATVANRWFDKRRGLVTGLLTASNASGQLVFLPSLAWLATTYGWRAASLAVSTVAIGIVFPIVAIVVRDRPQSIGLQPYGANEETPVPPRSAQPFRPAIGGLKSGLRSRNFWLLSASFFVCGATTNGLIGTHLISAAHDHGMSEVAGATLLAIIGVFDMVGTVASGWLTDRMDPRVLLFWYYALRGLSLLALPYVFDSPHTGLLVFTVFYGLDWVATVPPTVALTADTFGRERVGIVFGWIFASHQFGAAFAAWAAGASRGWFGSYTYAFVASGALCILAAGLSLRVGGPRPPGLPVLVPEAAAV